MGWLNGNHWSTRGSPLETFPGDPAGKVGAPHRGATRRGSCANSPREDCAGAQDHRAGEVAPVDGAAGLEPAGVSDAFWGSLGGLPHVSGQGVYGDEPNSKPFRKCPGAAKCGPCGARDWDSSAPNGGGRLCWSNWKSFAVESVITHMLHVWYIYLHLGDF